MAEFEGTLGAMLYVSDLKESVEFYRDRLGFEFLGYWDPVEHNTEQNYGDAHDPAYASVAVAGNSVGLHKWSGDGEVPAGGMDLHVQVGDVDAYHEELTDRGVEITAPPEDQDWGARMMTVRDPDGHIWDFLTPREGHHEG